jgi:(p)ppGpp synthase/HD superfamily hydrolase
VKKDFEDKFKKVIDFVEESDLDSPNKPVKPHVKRVGCYLFEKGFCDDVVIAGLLHDMLEWSSVTEEELRNMFGLRVLELIKANSKDELIIDLNERRRDTLQRCLLLGDEATAIKIADVIDGVRYHTLMANQHQVVSFQKSAKFLKENLSDNLKKIFLEDLEKILG